MKAVWNFSKKSSDLVAPSFPKPLTKKTLYLMSLLKTNVFIDDRMLSFGKELKKPKTFSRPNHVGSN